MVRYNIRERDTCVSPSDSWAPSSSLASCVRAVRSLARSLPLRPLWPFVFPFIFVFLLSSPPVCRGNSGGGSLFFPCRHGCCRSTLAHCVLLAAHSCVYVSIERICVCVCVCAAVSACAAMRVHVVLCAAAAAESARYSRGSMYVTAGTRGSFSARK